MIALGILHAMATPIMLTRYSALPDFERALFFLMFSSCGLAVALFGFVTLRSSSEANVPPTILRTGFGAAGTLSAALGLGAIWITPWNPVAYVLALVGLSGIRLAIKAGPLVR